MRNVIQWDLNSFFFQKLTKIAQKLTKNLQTPIATGWGLCPQIPVCDTFEYTSLLNTSPKLVIYTLPISGRVDRASATETVDLGSIPGRVKPKTIKLVFTASLLDVQQSKGQCKASTVCGRQVGRWQLDSKTERSHRCLLAKATW